MKCKVGSPKKRFIPKNMFCQVSDSFFSSEGVHFWEEQPGCKGGALLECLFLLLFPVFPLLLCITLHFISRVGGQRVTLRHVSNRPSPNLCLHVSSHTALQSWSVVCLY